MGPGLSFFPQRQGGQLTGHGACFIPCIKTAGQTVSRKPVTLFGRTALALGLAFLILQALALAIAWQFVFQPMIRRSVDDLTGLMVLAAQTWVELPPGTRPDFEREIAQRHHLRIFAAQRPLAVASRSFYLKREIEAALQRRTGESIALMAGNETDWVWADIPMAERILRVGFPSGRYGVQLPLAAMLIVLMGATLIFATALLLVRRISRQLAGVSQAAGVVGRGRAPEPLPETGPAELAQLAAAFNRMAGQVKDLLDNRTTLLAGISHDLRTPISRMRIALEMLDGEDKPRLLKQIDADLEEMNRIIATMLDISRSLQPEPAVVVDLVQLLKELAEEAKAQGKDVIGPDMPACVRAVGPLALKRIVSNLLQNALRYGEGSRVTLECECVPEATILKVLDLGPGIPQEELGAVLRPFYRLDASRSRATGGTGLGLAIAHQLAEANGWRLELQNRPGGGLEARLTIPEASPASAASSTVRSPRKGR
jgi:two-component system, OmpR family, osmolarity sensor histidine kinase EnvZ